MVENCILQHKNSIQHYLITEPNPDIIFNPFKRRNQREYQSEIAKRQVYVRKNQNRRHTRKQKSKRDRGIIQSQEGYIPNGRDLRNQQSARK